MGRGGGRRGTYAKDGPDDERVVGPERLLVGLGEGDGELLGRVRERLPEAGRGELEGAGSAASSEGREGRRAGWG